jgi:hypothetical protein
MFSMSQVGVQQLPASVGPEGYVDLEVTAVRLPCKLYVQLRNMQDMFYELAEAMAKGIQVSTSCQPWPYQSAWPLGQLEEQG